MALIKTTIRTIIIAANLIAAIAMLTCAFSPTIHPAEYPNCSYLGMLLPFTIIANAAFIVVWFFIKKFWTLISIVSFIICFSPIRDYCPINLFQKDTPSTALKFVSYNVMGFGNKEKDCDKNAIVRYLLDSDADIICLQEAYYIPFDKLQEAFKEKYPYIVRPDAKDAQLITISRLPIVGSQAIKYGESANSSCIVKLLSEKGDTITIFNNHLESYHLSKIERNTYSDMVREAAGRKEHTDTLANGEVWDAAVLTLTDKIERATVTRSLQADTLAQYISEVTSPYTIVCGDFNDSPVSYVHSKLSENLDDAYTKSGNGPGVSFNQNHMYFRIDNILISKNITPYRAKVDNSIKESDHYPIFCYLELH